MMNAHAFEENPFVELEGVKRLFPFLWNLTSLEERGTEASFGEPEIGGYLIEWRSPTHSAESRTTRA